MRSLIALTAAIVLAGGLVSCTSGGSSGPTCSFQDPATLAQSAWPKFRHDLQNTGAIENAQAAFNSGQLRWVFPAPPADPKGPFAASAVLNGTATDPASATRVYIGSTDGGFYALDPNTGEQDTDFLLTTDAPITGTALVGLRNGSETIFIAGGNGQFFALDASAKAIPSNWPFAFTGFVSTSPTINMTDGTLYTGSLDGFVAGVCPNGVARFGLSVIGMQSSPAVGADGTVYFGADDHQLRALRADGVLKWAFSASAPILTAPVVDPADGSVFVADRAGRVLKVTSSGAPSAGFDFAAANGGPVGPILSSPALAGNRLYFGSDDGNLYAVDKQTAKVDWVFPTGAEVVSSPAVATGGAQPIVIIGSNDGNVYFVEDNGTSAVPLVTFTIGAAVRSSPAIGADGTVYVGADDGRVYAIR